MYNTIDELKKALPEARIIQLTDDEGKKPATIADDNPDCDDIILRANECGADADAEVDSYCGKQYAVPFTTPTAEVKRLAREVWIYNLYKRRVVTEEIEKRYDKAIKQLQDIAKGIKTLGIDPPPAAPTDSGAESNKETSDRIFTRDSMEGF